MSDNGTRTIIKDGNIVYMRDLKKDDVFEIRDVINGKTYNSKWVACSDPFYNDNGICSINSKELEV